MSKTISKVQKVTTLSSIAIQRNNEIEVIDLLVNNGAYLNSRVKEELASLHFAIEYKRSSY